MFVEDLQEEFYKVVSGKRLLVLVNYDVDAICACKILQSLFRCDNTLYTIVPVEGTEDLVSAFSTQSEQVKYVLLINCGGTIDIVETLQPEEDVIIFIVDSHKPTDVCNVYSSSQVRVLGKPDDNESIPEFNEIFSDGESDEEQEEEEESGEEGEGRASKRMRMAEEEILKRREKRLWEEKRNRLMFEYTQFSFYGRTSSIIVFELVWHLGKDNIDSLWWAIIGVTNQIVMGLCTDQQYLNELHVLQLHMSRLVTNDTEEDGQVCKLPTTKITSQKDLRLVLYRHWTVQASLRHSMCTAIKLRLWTIRGERRLLQLLAEIGLPLTASKQNYTAMDVSLRKDFFSMMEKVANTYELSDLIHPSFTLTYGFRSSFQSSDYVYALTGILDSTNSDKSHCDCFNEALECLSRNKGKLFDEGVERSKKLIMCVYRQMQSLIDMKQISSAGPFLYFVLQEGSLDWKVFSNPDVLLMLARTSLLAHYTLSRSKRTALLPLIASSPCHSNPSNCIVLGIPPVTEVVPRNFFGKAFAQALESINATPLLTYFDSSIIKIKVEDRPKFFDKLSSILS